MDKTNRTPQGGEQLTKINSSALKPYLKAGFTPIPLHTWDSKSKIGGKVRSDGKRPRDKDWTTRPYDPQAELYTRAADQKRMAGDAMHLIEPVGPGI